MTTGGKIKRRANNTMSDSSKETVVISVRVSKDLKENIIPEISGYVNPGVLFEAMVRTVHGQLKELLKSLPATMLGRGKGKSVKSEHVVVQLSEETHTSCKALQKALTIRLGKKPSFPTTLNLVLNSIDVKEIESTILEAVDSDS